MLEKVGRVLKRVRRLLRGDVEEQSRFTLNELKRLNTLLRYRMLGDLGDPGEIEQTKASFDHQWSALTEGAGLPGDPAFDAGAEDLVCRMTGLGRDWFEGKRVLDLGCGMGRFTLPLLALGAQVTACDQSDWAIERTRSRCGAYGEALTTERRDLLEWGERAAFDLVFSFGVVHHTGNTYLAIRNAAAKVAPGGRLFLMVYGFPETLGDFRELNHYDELRAELRDLSLEQRRRTLVDRYGPLAHGYFDAVSPTLNDLLTFEELKELLNRLGFEDVHRTVPNRNHHVVARKRLPDKG